MPPPVYRMTPPEVEASGEIVWRLHLATRPDRVFDTWLDPLGQARFWCERSERVTGGYRLHFIDGTVSECLVVRADRPGQITFSYFDAIVDIVLQSVGHGTDLTLRTCPHRGAEWLEAYAGWLNVLLPLKAWVDFGVDLRNHDPSRTWRERYVDQ